MIIRNRLLSVLAIALTSLLVIASAPQESIAPHKDAIHVIFDMNGVLVTDRGHTKILGIKPFIEYALLHTLSLKNPLKIKQVLRKKLFDFMLEVQPKQQHDCVTYDTQGNELPPLMCDWLKGSQSCSQILSKVEAKALEKKLGIEQQIVTSMCRMIFTPELFIQTQHWAQETLDFVAELKADGAHVYILSNWDPESFKLMRTTYPETFALFDGILISGDAHMVKPDTAIYEHMLATFNIDRHNAFFIDDQEPNVQAAQYIGITSILCKPQKVLLSSSGPDISAAKEAFYAWQQQRSKQNTHASNNAYQAN